MRQGWPCMMCGGPIREDGEHLYNRPGDVEVWVCSRRCLQAYNDGEPTGIQRVLTGLD